MTVALSRRIALALISGACALLVSCSEAPRRQKVPEATPPAAPVAQADSSPQPQTKPLPPPDLNNVQEVVKRVFKDKAVIDTSLKPNFISGDFNGDQSQDIAVVVKPASGKLSEMNEEYPPWILKDPFTPSGSRPPRLHIDENETLLAVIHGFGPDGWSDPQATQTYLLKNAVGSTLRAQPEKEFRAANRGKVLPGVQGDLIAEVLKGSAGYFYYRAATYSWYDPKTFKGDAQSEPGMFHSSSKPKEAISPAAPPAGKTKQGP